MNVTSKQYHYNSTPAFGVNCRSFVNKIGTSIGNDTDFFRNDLAWEYHIKRLDRVYKKQEKVNIYSIASSSGEEAFSHLMLLIKLLGLEKAKKFFPIIASDKNEKVIQNAKKGIVKVNENDIAKIKRFLGKDYSEYIQFDNDFNYDPNVDAVVCTGKIQPLLTDNVIFKRRSIAESIPKIERDNSVILCRNVLSYLEEEEQLEVIKRFLNRLGHNSMLITGEYELGSGLNPVFLDNGFDVADWVGISPCYVKAAKNAKDYLSNPEFLMANFANKK